MTSIQEIAIESKAAAEMPVEENEAVVRRYIEEVWNQHNLDTVDELVSPDYLDHAAVPEHQHGIAADKHVMNWLFTVFPDHRFDIEDAVADGDTVAVRGTCSGAQESKLWGIPPTGERFAVQQVHWFRVAGGKVAEHWAVRDDLGMMRQLGPMPTQGSRRRGPDPYVSTRVKVRNEMEQLNNRTDQEVLDEHLKLSN